MGSSGPQISVIGYGGWEAGGTAWGATQPDDRVVAALGAGFDAGINWVDTAEIYGHGRSEELIGRAIRDRSEVMVFTKVAPKPRGTGYAPTDISRAANASLGRLRRDVIDLYQLHWSDEKEVPLEDAWAAMAGLVDAGLVRWIGVSNFTAELMERCERIRHVDSVQPQLSMLWQERIPLLDASKANGTGVIAYGALAYGLLTGAITHTTIFPDDDWRSGKHGLRAYEQLFAPGRREANLRTVDSLASVAQRLDVPLAQLALAWVLQQPAVTGAIAGSRSVSHIRENAAASNVKLAPDDLTEIQSILQGRGEVVIP